MGIGVVVARGPLKPAAKVRFFDPLLALNRDET